MANNLPYFRFFVQEWQNSKVSVENYKMQGLYINICAYYWVNDCDLTLLTLQKKFKDCKTLITEMIKNGLIKHEKKHNKIQIDFLNIQYDLLSEKRKLRQAAGMRGGNATAMLKQKGSYKTYTKDNNKDKIRERVKTDSPTFVDCNDPILSDVISFFSEKEKDTTEAEKFFYWYEANGWTIGKNKIKNWRAAAEKWLKNDIKPITNNKTNTNEPTKQQSAQSEFNKRYGTNFGI